MSNTTIGDAGIQRLSSALIEKPNLASRYLRRLSHDDLRELVIKAFADAPRLGPTFSEHANNLLTSHKHALKKGDAAAVEYANKQVASFLGCIGASTIDEESRFESLDYFTANLTRDLGIMTKADKPLSVILLQLGGEYQTITETSSQQSSCLVEKIADLIRERDAYDRMSREEDRFYLVLRHADEEKSGNEAANLKQQVQDLTKELYPNLNYSVTVRTVRPVSDKSTSEEIIKSLDLIKKSFETDTIARYQAPQ